VIVDQFHIESAAVFEPEDHPPVGAWCADLTEPARICANPDASPRGITAGRPSPIWRQDPAAFV
jgi:hypothetical protein